MPEFKTVELRPRKLPLWLKLQIWAGKYIHYKRNVRGGADQVCRLPRRRIVKLRCHPNELEAMEYVRQHTTIPVPRIFKVYKDGDHCHILMEEVPGDYDTRIGYGQMTSEQVKTFGRELADYIGQLRSLQPPEPGFIGSLSLGSSLDHRLSGTRFGPFHSIADFHTYLRRGHPLENWGNKPDVVKTHSKPETYTVKFTHADLHPNNIIVKDGHITAIIDWEFAGWYPEYWEYTKMYWGERESWANFYKAVEEEDEIVKYPDEYAGELAIWMRMDPWSYDDPPWSPDDEASKRVKSEETEPIPVT